MTSKARVAFYSIAFHGYFILPYFISWSSERSFACPFFYSISNKSPTPLTASHGKAIYQKMYIDGHSTLIYHIVMYTAGFHLRGQSPPKTLITNTSNWPKFCTCHDSMAVVSPQTFSWEETKLSRAASGMSLGLCFDTVTWHEANMLDNRQLAVFLRLEVVSSIPAGSTMIYRFLCVGSFISFPVPEHQN